MTITCLTISGSDFSAAMSPAIVAANRLPPKMRAPALFATKTVRIAGRAASQPRIARLWRTHDRLSRGLSVVDVPNVNGQLVRAMHRVAWRFRLEQRRDRPRQDGLQQLWVEARVLGVARRGAVAARGGAGLGSGGQGEQERDEARREEMGPVHRGDSMMPCRSAQCACSRGAKNRQPCPGGRPWRIATARRRRHFARCAISWRRIAAAEPWWPTLVSTVPLRGLVANQLDAAISIRGSCARQSPQSWPPGKNP